uniref:Uncharacterized protein n=1 Tax=Guillardia theta TaxID=55529 RepID=A0A7S4UGS0_GUITH
MLSLITFLKDSHAQNAISSRNPVDQRAISEKKFLICNACCRMARTDIFCILGVDQPEVWWKRVDRTFLQSFKGRNIMNSCLNFGQGGLQHVYVKFCCHSRYRITCAMAAFIHSIEKNKIRGLM